YIVNLRTPGAQTIQFTDSANSSVTGQATINVASVSVSLDSSGNLVISSAPGVVTNDTVTISVLSSLSPGLEELQILAGPGTFLFNNVSAGFGSSNGQSVLIPLSAISGSLINVALGDGSDTLLIDFSGGLFTKTINFDGGNPTTAPGDQLVLNGGSF